MDDARSAPADEWKDKYFRALNELDQAERTRAAAVARLSRDLYALLVHWHGPAAALGGFEAALHDGTADESVLARLHALTAQCLEAPPAATDEAATARAILQGLVDHLSLPAPAQADMTALTPKLQRAVDATTLAGLARELAELLVDCVGGLEAELAGLGGFLAAVKLRLEEVTQVLAGSRASRQRATGARGEFNAAMQAGLASLRGQVGAATSLERLKEDIRHQIAALDARLDAYVETAAAAGGEQDAVELECTRQLVELERETGLLREQLVRAQAAARNDGLTGLPNRLAYDERVADAHGGWRRDGRPLSIAVLDLDRFKSINDTWGHVAGDRVLKRLARELRMRVRPQDFLARYGGEEFVLLLPGTTRAEAAEVVDALRRHVASCRFTFKDVPVAVTVSCGVAEFAAGDAPATVFGRADRALYLAKARGRNRCEVQDAAA